MAAIAERKILLVEDEVIIALAQERALKKHGATVVSVRSGESAVAAVAENPEIDLILMDIDLGSGMSGTTAAERILEFRTVPIVFLTSHAEKEMVDRVKGITRYGYVLKNGGEFVLLEAISMAFELFEAHHRLEQRNHFIQTILDNLPIGLAVNYIDEGQATHMNRKFEEIYGWPSSVITDIDSFFEHVYPDPEERKELMDRIMSDIASGEPDKMRWEDLEITRSDGSKAIVTALNIPIYEQNFMISTVQDTTENYEFRRRLEESNRALTEEIARRDVLSQELNHRVKNNLALISSLVRLKEDAVDGEVDLSDLVHRIDAIQLMHEQLHERGAENEIDLSIYMTDLVNRLFASISSEPVSLEAEIPELIVSTRVAVPLGLIVNELATNALKHAFPGADERSFRIIVEHSDGTCSLTVENGGQPLPADEPTSQPGKMGLRLVEALVAQLDGTMSVERTPRTAYTIAFPLHSEA